MYSHGTYGVVYYVCINVAYNVLVSYIDSVEGGAKRGPETRYSRESLI